MAPENDAANVTSNPPSLRWRTVDIVVAAVLGVAFGVVFFAWNNLWAALSPAFTAFPPAQAFMYGMWLLPGVLGGLVIRKPGAAIFTETVAAIVSTFFGAPQPMLIILYGLGQGFGAELAYAVFRYRRWTLPVAFLGAALAALMPGILDPILYGYTDWGFGIRAWYFVIVEASTLLIAGLGSWALVRALAQTGVLAPFASGREQRLA
jgi:energy-coupling factor transport system permease protein